MKNNKLSPTNTAKKPFLIVIMGIVGFLVGHIVIFGADTFDFRPTKSNAVFSEIKFTPKQLNCLPKDSLCGKIISYEGNINDSLRIFITYFAKDSIKKTKIDTCTQKGKKDTIYKNVSYYKDTVKVDTLTQSQLETQFKRRYASDIDFFRKNPVFALWVVFILGMFVAWFIAFFPLWYFNKALIVEFQKEGIDLWSNKVSYMFFSFAILVLFHLMLVLSFMDSSPFNTFLFLPGFDIRFVAMNVIGIIASTPIFMGMLYVYRLCSDLQATEIEKIKGLKQKLKILLLSISISFSLVMITTALLYTSINKLEFITKVNADLGYAPIHNDFVIAYGALYSILIIIFYMPAVIRIYNLELQIPAHDGIEIPLAFPMKNLLAEILKSSAPLATSIISSLLGFYLQ